MNISVLDDLHTDAMTGSRFMGMLGLSEFDLRDPSRFSKFESVIGFFSRFPEETGDFLLGRISRGAHDDRLQKAYEYMCLLERKQSLDRELESVKGEGSVIPADADPLVRIAHAQREMSVAKSLGSVARDLEVYEK